MPVHECEREYRWCSNCHPSKPMSRSGEELNQNRVNPNTSFASRVQVCYCVRSIVVIIIFVNGTAWWVSWGKVFGVTLFVKRRAVVALLGLPTNSVKIACRWRVHLLRDLYCVLLLLLLWRIKLTWLQVICVNIRSVRFVQKRQIKVGSCNRI